MTIIFFHCIIMLECCKTNVAKEQFYDEKNLPKFGMLMLII